MSSFFRFTLFPLILISNLTLASPEYQIGSEWGKKPVTPESLSKESKIFQRSALATAKIGGATSFYLGKFAGKHLMATNYHVMSYASRCNNAPINFTMLQVRANCTQFLGSWSQIDLALFTIVPQPQDELKLESVAKSFAFHANIYPSQELLTIGFGVSDNPFRQMVANQDSDCRVFSRQNEFRLMGDPDEFNPGNYEAWSFAMGCEGSHGDSGSAMVDRNTGEVIGIIWTGKTPKAERIRDSVYLEKIFQEKSEEIWTELAYAVPASKMFEVLSAELKMGHLNQEATPIISDMLSK